MSRREKEDVFRRNLLAEAATELFKQKSYYGTTVEEITKKAEFGKGTFYRYFSHKEEIPFFLLLRCLEEFNNSVENTVQSSGDFSKILFILATKLSEYHSQTLNLIFIVHNILQEQQGFNGKSESARDVFEDWQNRINKAMKRKNNLLSTFFASGMKAGYFHSYNSYVMACALDNLLRGATSPHYIVRGEEKDNYITGLLQIFMRGACL